MYVKVVCPCMYVRVSASIGVCLTYDGGEASSGILPCDQLVQVRVVKLKTLQKRDIPPLSFSVEDVK